MSHNAVQAVRIEITGIVQGVGFRPFVYNLAQHFGLAGWVLNHSGGVDIHLEGDALAIEAMLTAIDEQAPPLAVVETIHVEHSDLVGLDSFEIRHSRVIDGASMLISPDVATCEDCVRELLDPEDRRFRYPFINCTNCGPRFTIIDDIPYDRPKTTMRVFPLCPECQAEYVNPADRRFHAQPNACPICGPHIWLVNPRGEAIAGDEGTPATEDVLRLACEMLLNGKLLAIKGLGGFHLACDATNAEAVALLRRRKRRPDKPLAVMVPNLAVAHGLCDVSPQAEALLSSPQCPIVLLEQRAQRENGIAPGVAPGTRMLGIMLPYTPLHHLLLDDVGRPLVMTSGNLSDEPIAKDNNEAVERLGALVDALLLHNRDIHVRYDDSVWHMQWGGGEVFPQPIRRARGYAPFPIQLRHDAGQVLAVGPQFKNTFCITRGKHAFLSQHIGDLDDLDALTHQREVLATYQHLFRLEPNSVARDLHPDYVSTRIAREYAAQHGLPEPIAIQHHEAHVASCLAENGWTPADGPVIGVAFDGTGYGHDGAIWGGEWMVGDYGGFHRAAHLRYLPLPGGDAATREPWRIAVAYLSEMAAEVEIPAGLCSIAQRDLLLAQIARNINTPLTSSMGRLFDAVSALLGLCKQASFEAQAAIMLEQCAMQSSDDRIYDWALESEGDGLVVNPAAMFVQILRDRRHGVLQSTIAMRFHRTVADMIARVCQQLRSEYGINTAALTGGVFQNRLLTDLATRALCADGFGILLHHRVPCNDGGVSLGQAVLAYQQEVKR